MAAKHAKWKKDEADMPALSKNIRGVLNQIPPLLWFARNIIIESLKLPDDISSIVEMPPWDDHTLSDPERFEYIHAGLKALCDRLGIIARNIHG